MGQRHQIYVKLPKRREEPGHVIGIHHQWLYGRTALQSLKNFLQFTEKADYMIPFSYSFSAEDPIFALRALYSLNVETGYFHNTHPLVEDEKIKTPQGEIYQKTSEPGEETKDPRLGDNNNGITIIDLSEFTQEALEAAEKGGKRPKVKYCFLSLGGLECLKDKDFNKNPKNHFRPIDAKEWISIHYKNPFSMKCEADCECHTDKKLESQHKKELAEVSEEHRSLVDYLSKFGVLTLAEVKKLFPAMYKKQKKAG